MRNISKHCLSLALLFSVQRAHPFFDFDAFFDEQIEIMKQMRESMKSSQKRIRGQLKTYKQEFSSIDIQEDEKERLVKIVLKGIDTKEINATLSEENDLLTIKAEHDVIKIYTKDKLISVEAKQNKKIKTDDGNSAPEEYFYSSSYIQSAKTLSAPLNLEMQKIDYDQESKTVTILIDQAEQKPKSKSIPVNFISQPQKELAQEK